jgi:hypothetical protein
MSCRLPGPLHWVQLLPLHPPPPPPPLPLLDHPSALTYQLAPPVQHTISVQIKLKIVL